MITFTVCFTDRHNGITQTHQVNACHPSEVRAMLAVVRPHWFIHHVGR